MASGDVPTVLILPFTVNFEAQNLYITELSNSLSAYAMSNVLYADVHLAGSESELENESEFDDTKDSAARESAERLGLEAEELVDFKPAMYRGMYHSHSPCIETSLKREKTSE